MTRKGERTRVGRCVYQDASGLAARVNVGTETRERRFPLGTAREKIKRWQDQTKAELRKRQADRPTRGTLAADAAIYLRAVAGMAGIVERTRHIDDWLAVLGHRDRDRITPVEIRQALEDWRVERRYSASSLNHRRTALQHLFSVLDGKGSANPVRSVPRYREPDAVARGLDWPTVRAILREMPPSVTRLRIAIMATTGLPHSTLGRLTATDVDVSGRTFARPDRRKGAGTKSALMPLSRRAAWYFRLLGRANGWGPFSRRSLYESFRRGCRHAEMAAAERGELLDLSRARPYDVRHGFASAVLAATGNLQTTKELLGHASLVTTLRYTRSAVPPALIAATAAVERLMALRREKTPPRAKKAEFPQAPVAQSG
jgi:site-specific recombinase XerD